MNRYAFATIFQLRELFRKKEIDPKEFLSSCLARIAKYDPALQSALEIFEYESILDTALHDGPLAGIPGIIKDNICQKGRIASCASKILQGVRAPYDATVTSKLKEAGALLVGRANCDEFAMGSSTETSAYQKTKNPWDHTRVPGGSSGGSAAAVAAGFVPWSLGTETGGSVRQPAAFCGIVGLKPTYGRVSRYGLIAYGSSLDQAGVFARTVFDTALVFSTIAGSDVHDSTTLDQGFIDYTKQLHDTIPAGLRIGIVENMLYAPGMDKEIIRAHEDAIKLLERLGATMVKVKLPTIDYSAAVYFIVSRAEAASNLARFDGVRYGFRDTDGISLAQMYAKTKRHGFGKEVRRRIMVGNYVLSAGHADAFYQKATMVRQLIRDELDRAYKDVHLLIMPTHPMPAFTFGAFDVDQLQMDLQDYFTCPANLAGIPAISIPIGFTANKLPIGMQFFAPHCKEELLLQVAHVYEQNTQWHTQHPAME
jgi:aspartyl-tRNA(Asn)/glutamyl-tRNA(Gln) amidotransferase subunit A